MNAAKLVELMVDLVEYQSLVVVCCEVPHYVVYCREGNQSSIKPEMTTNTEYKYLTLLSQWGQTNIKHFSQSKSSLQM